MSTEITPIAPTVDVTISRSTIGLIIIVVVAIILVAIMARKSGVKVPKIETPKLPATPIAAA